MVKKPFIIRGANRIHCLLASILLDAWRLSSELRILSTSHHQSNWPQFTHWKETLRHLHVSAGLSS